MRERRREVVLLRAVSAEIEGGETGGKKKRKKTEHFLGGGKRFWMSLGRRELWREAAVGGVLRAAVGEIFRGHFFTDRGEAATEKERKLKVTEGEKSLRKKISEEL